MSGFHELDPAQLQAVLDEGNVLLVDVRNPPEFATGVIAGARLVPLHQVPGEMAGWDRQARIVIYCHSGMRSAQACSYLAQNDFADLWNLRGGIVAWRLRGLPLVEP